MSINELEQSSLGFTCKPLFHEEIKPYIPENLSATLKIKAI